MGQAHRKDAEKRTRQAVIPTADEIVAEVRRAHEERMASMIRLHDLAGALNKDKTAVMKATKKLGIKLYLDNRGAGYLTREEAAKVAERMM